MTKPQKKILIVTTLAPPAFGGTPTMVGKYTECFPDDSYCFLADQRTKYVPHVSPYLRCNYYFFDGTEIKKGETPTATPENISKGVRPNLGYKRVGTLSGRIKYVLQYIVSVPLETFGLVKTIYSAYCVGLRVLEYEHSTHILAVSDKGPSLVVSYLLSRKTGVPYSVFLFDLYKGYFLPAPHLLLSWFMDKKIVTGASHLFSAGQGISEVYEKRYGRECLLVPNSCVIPSPPPRVRSANRCLRIVYTGMYYWAQQDTIERFQRLTRGVVDIAFDIYSYDALIKGHRGLSWGESRRAQQAADVLLLPLSFYPRTAWFRKIIQTAPTGKLAEYLVSGVPILVYAPSYAWVARYMKEHRAAVVVDGVGKEDLLRGLQLLRDDTVRQSCVRNAFRLAQANHDLRKNCRIICDVMFGGI